MTNLQPQAFFLDMIKRLRFIAGLDILFVMTLTTSVVLPSDTVTVLYLF